MSSTSPNNMTTLQALRGGSVLARYTLLERVGRGGQADVWSAWDPTAECVVAIKVIQNLHNSFTASRQFSQEAHLIARLQHPNILPLYDFGEMMTLRFLVTRYMVGGSLSSLLTNGPLSPPKLAPIAVSVAHALDFIHEQSIVHRDLKPANILLDSREIAFLSDFGIAREVGVTSTLAMNTPEGTVPYMSPEQMDSERITPRADLYSLGILLFQLLTGQLPFDGRYVLAVRQRQFGDQLPDPAELNSTLPEGVAPILRQLTMLDPSQRPESSIKPVSQLIALFGLAPPAEILIPPAESSGGEIVHNPLEEARPDALHLLTTKAQTWSPVQEYPYTLTSYKFLSAVYPDPASIQPPVSDRISQILLYGTLKYEPANGAKRDRYWASTPEAMRCEVCWAMLAKLGATPDTVTPTVEAVLALANSLPPVDALPIAVRQILLDLTRSASIEGGKAAVGKGALKLLVRTPDTPPGYWQETDPLIADLLAELVIQKTPLAGEALQAITRSRSANAVQQLVGRMDARRQLNVLTSIWAEAGSLPHRVFSIPQYVITFFWIGFRQLVDRPTWLIADYAALSIGCAVALALFIYLTFRSPDFLNSRRIQNAFGNGLLFGLQLGLSGVLAYAISERLRIVSKGVRVVLSTLSGGVIGVWAFANFHFLFYDLSSESHLILPGAILFAFGYALAGLTRRMSIRGALISLGIISALMMTWLISLNTGDDPLLFLYEDKPWLNWLLVLLAGTTAGFISQGIIYLYRRNAQARQAIGRNS